MSNSLPQLQPSNPTMGNAFTRWLGRSLLRLSGWKVTGELPDAPKFIAAAAPHTSNWDWVFAMYTLLALGIRINYMIKHTTFWWPLSIVLKATGAFAVDRSSPSGLIDSVRQQVLSADKVVFVITPEGTRKRVDQWKTGFLRLSYATGLPLLMVSWDYPSKTVQLGPEMPLTGDIDKDLEAVREHFRQFTGGRPEYQSP